MSITSHTSPKSPLPGQEDQSARLAASAEVGQVEDTISLEAFQRWLETKAHEAHVQYFQGSEGEALWQEVERCKPVTLLIAECRVATKMLMQFKLEQGA